MSEHKLLKISYIFIFILFLSIFLLHNFSIISYQSLFSILIAAIFATINFVMAVLSIEISGKKHAQDALGTFMKGMLIRMAILVLLIIISIKFLDINLNSFIFSILIFYIYYLIIEVIFLLIREFGN